MRSLLDISSINELIRISIGFLLAFNQAHPDFYFFVDITLGIGVDGNRGEWVLK